MKKILRYCLVVLMAAFGLSTYAQTDELTWNKLLESGKGSAYQVFSGKTITSSAVYAGQASSGADKYIQLRTNSNDAGIVTTASGGKLKSVTIDFNESTTDRSVDIYGDNTAYSAATELYGNSIKGTKLGTIAANDETKTLTVEGDYTFVGLRSTNGAIYIDKITIVWEGGGSTVTVPTPSISGTTPFTESTEVTITGTPEGGKTYYTTDGSDPTSSSTAYTAAFTINETTTVKAINYDKDGNASSVASKTFTKETIEKAANIAAFNALAANTKVELTLTNAQVLGAGNNNYAIKDATGSTVIFQSGLSYTKGQILNGTITGIRADYGGFTEIKTITANTLNATDGTITPKTATPEEVIAAGYFADTYKMERVECTLNNGRYYITVGDNEIQIYDNFKYGYSITADGKYNLVGILGAYNNIPYQFWLTEAPEAAEEITYPEAANIAAVKELASGTTVKVTLTNAVVNYAKGTKEIFIEDATGGIELFDLGEDFAFTAGQVLNGTLTAQYTLFRNLPELTAVNGVTNADEITATSGEAPTPIEMTPEEAAKVENTCKLIIVKNITLVTGNSNYYTDADKTLQIYDKFNLGYTPNTESAMDYTGILVPYYDVFELCPTVEPTESASGGGETPAATSVMIQFEESDICTKGSAKAQYANGDFKLNCVDTDASKLEIDANSAYFGTAEDYQKFTHRLKTGGKSGSKNSLSLTIPSDGTLKVYVRTGSNSATDRNIVLTQNDTELYNKVVQEADAVVVTINEKETNIYPVISVAVKAGEVTIGYPVNALNFYAFEFIAGASGIQNVVKPVVENGIRYNLAGQRVDENYKGVVIMNGKKFVVK